MIAGHKKELKAGELVWSLDNTVWKMKPINNKTGILGERDAFHGQSKMKTVYWISPSTVRGKNCHSLSVGWFDS